MFYWLAYAACYKSCRARLEYLHATWRRVLYRYKHTHDSRLPQAPLAYAGVSFANRRPFQILQDMSGVLQPVRHDIQQIKSCLLI